MKQLLKKTTLLLLTGVLLTHSTYLTSDVTDDCIVCSSTDNSNAVSPCTAFGDTSEHTLLS